jgi:putative FmdB family regulatory protein
MPTYEYVCSECKNEWEFEQSMKDEALKECPRCHKSSARRQISRGTGFILKGGGWYADLYSSSSNKGESGGSSGASSSTASSTSSSGSGDASSPAASTTSPAADASSSPSGGTKSSTT